MNLHTPMMKNAALHKSETSMVISTLLIGSPFIACINPRIAQPCGTSKETVLPCVCNGGVHGKDLIMPIMPVTVNTPPNSTPPCLVFLRKELTKMPNDDALKIIPAAINATDRRSPH